MNDAKLADIARKFKEADAQVKEWEKIKNKYKDKINAEMQRRGTRSITTNGLKITYVTPTGTYYDPAVLEAALSKTLFYRCLKLEVDSGRLSALVQSGKVSARLLDECSRTYEKASYPLVNPASGEQQ